MDGTRIIGIDFGTHKTLVSRWDAENDRPILVRLRSSGDEMPTTVHVSHSGDLCFGEEAEELGVANMEGYKRAFKRDLGAGVTPYLLQSYEYSAGRLAGEYLSWIKKYVETESLHGEVDKAVITVPATFSPAARNELREAALFAGLSKVELLDEPAAAGFAFLKSRPDLWRDGNLLIFDWGAGTLDLAVLQLNKGIPEVLCDLVGGKLGLGGEDIDRHLMQMVNKKLALLGLPRLERREPEEVDRVRRKVTEWKMRHGAKPGAVWRLEGLSGVPPHAELTWTSEEISERVIEKVREAVSVCEEFLNRAKEKGCEVSGVLLIGGSTQLLSLKIQLEQRLPGIRILSWDQRISAVALGAAWLAAKGSTEVSSQDSLPSQEPAFDKSRWDSVSEFSEGFACVSSGGKYGFIDTSGRVVVPVFWEDACGFCEGLARVRYEGAFGFIDPSSKLVIPTTWADASSFYRGLAYAKTAGKEEDCCKHGLIDRSGQVVIWFQISSEESRYGRVAARNRDKVVFPPYCSDKWFVAFSEGVWLCGRYDVDRGFWTSKRYARYWFITAEGEDIIYRGWTKAKPFSEGLACVKAPDYGYSETLFGKQIVGPNQYAYINKSGKVVITGSWDDATSFSDGLAQVKSGGKVGFIDYSGAVVIPYQWDNAKDFCGGLAPVTSNGKWGLVRKSGEIVIPLEWDNSWSAYAEKHVDSLQYPVTGSTGGDVPPTFIRLMRKMDSKEALVLILNSALVEIWRGQVPVESCERDVFYSY